MMACLAGLDIGTTGLKITVYDTSGRYLGGTYRDYPVTRTQAQHEVDPETIFQAACDAISEMHKRYPDIIGIGVASFGETFVLLDVNDRALRPAMLYTDPRGETECNELICKLSVESITDITGVTPHAMYSIPKLMWLKRNEPTVFAKAKRVLLIEDYIVYMLTGVAQIDYSMASRTMGFDIEKLCWSNTLFSAAGIDPILFSTPVPTGTIAGTLKAVIQDKLRTPQEMVIVSVSQDQIAAAIGSGVFEEGFAADGAGTVECVTPVFTSADKRMLAKGHYAVVPYLNPGKYVCYAFTYTGGALIKWFIENLAGYAAKEAEQSGKSLYEALEEGFTGKPTGLLALPYFAGAATPYMDSGAQGAIVGLTLAHTQRDIYWAIMEGICYEMRLNIERLAVAGIQLNSLRATGGGANSRIWMQMKADVLNLPITSLDQKEAGTAGSAMLTGVALNVFRDLAHAAQVMVIPRETYAPRADAHANYTACFERYKRLYEAVRPLL